MDITQVEELVRELGGVPGFVQRPVSYRVVDDGCEIMFVKELGPESSFAIFLRYTDAELGPIPNQFARRYVEARLNVIRIAAEAFEFRETV